MNRFIASKFPLQMLHKDRQMPVDSYLHLRIGLAIALDRDLMEPALLVELHFRAKFLFPEYVLFPRNQTGVDALYW